MAALISLQYRNIGITPLLEQRIVGGQETTIEEFPWQVSMQRFGSLRCGGSVLSASRVLTACHCTDGITTAGLSIRAGSSTSQSGGQLISVSRLVNHPQYNANTVDFDVAVLWLSSPLNLGTHPISVVPLPSQNEGVGIGQLAQVSGWGTVCENCATSPRLRYVSVPIVSNADCNQAYRGGITDRMICAGFPEGGRDACQGDSGGPLTISGRQVGIVSWGAGCAAAGFPGVYTRVAAVRNWINSAV